MYESSFGLLLCELKVICNCVKYELGQVKQNVVSVHDVSRSGSKRSGCPRPVFSSAYPSYLWFY